MVLRKEKNQSPRHRTPRETAVLDAAATPYPATQPDWCCCGMQSGECYSARLAEHLR